MKVVIQRVSSAKVTKKDTSEVVGQIGNGLFLLLGVKKGDTKEKADEIVNKILKLRIMSDDNGKMNLSIIDTKSEILLVSQFTLLANTKDGNRPSFIDAEEPAKAKEMYEYIVNKLKESGNKVETGSFGNYMEIETVLDGPVTIVLEN
jgi:D-tyrosyl-tRNA(Tyr) deacylase